MQPRMPAEHWLTSLYNKDTSETMALLYPAIHTAELGFILGQVQEKLERNHGEPVAMDPPSRRWKSKLIKGGEKYEVVKIVYGNKDIVDHSTTEKIGLVLVAGGNWKVAYYSIQDKKQPRRKHTRGFRRTEKCFCTNPLFPLVAVSHINWERLRDIKLCRVNKKIGRYFLQRPFYTEAAECS